MRALIGLTVAMGVLIVAGTATLAVLIVRRAATVQMHAPHTQPAPLPVPLAATLAVTLGEPAGTRLLGIAASGGALAIALTGGGPDRIVLVDPASLHVTARIIIAPRSSLADPPRLP